MKPSNTNYLVKCEHHSASLSRKQELSYRISIVTLVGHRWRGGCWRKSHLGESAVGEASGFGQENPFRLIPLYTVARPLLRVVS